MRVLKEAEAIRYLERLNSAFTPEDNSNSAFKILSILLKVKQIYLTRLIQNETTRSLVDLPVSSTGFPDMATLMVDAKKAVEALAEIDAKRTKTVLPLFEQLELRGVENFNERVGKILPDLKKDDSFARSIRQFNNTMLEDLFERCELKELAGRPGLLFYSTDEKHAHDRFGYLKYIDATSSGSGVSITDVKKIYRNRGKVANAARDLLLSRERVSTAEVMKTVGAAIKPMSKENAEPVIINQQFYDKEFSRPLKGISGGLEVFGPNTSSLRRLAGVDRSVHQEYQIQDILCKLSPELREILLSTDFTNLPSGSFQEMIRYSADLAPYLEGVKLKKLVVKEEESLPEKKGFWVFGKRKNK